MKNIYTKTFNDASELETALATIPANARSKEAQTKPMDGSLMNVRLKDGEPLSRLTVVEEKLTDGSFVYDVVLS